VTIYNKYRDLALDAEAWGSIRRFSIDGRRLTGSTITQEFSDALERNVDQATLLYFYTYRVSIAGGIPEFIKSFRFNYNIQPNWTGATAFPDAPASAPLVDYLYYYQRINSASSLGATGISDVPTTWRNYTGAFRFNLERNELSSAQQEGIVNGIEREILAGMSSSYLSNSQTARYIDFANNSAGANAALDQTAMVANGWSIINGSQMEKFITNPNNGTAYRWRILHQ